MELLCLVYLLVKITVQAQSPAGAGLNVPTSVPLGSSQPCKNGYEPVHLGVQPAL